MSEPRAWTIESGLDYTEVKGFPQEKSIKVIEAEAVAELLERCRKAIAEEWEKPGHSYVGQIDTFLKALGRSHHE